jgi:hypothetical protein
MEAAMPRHLAAALFAALVAAPLAAQPIRVEPVIFAPGAESAAISGRIVGRETVDYRVGAEAGQRLSVTLETDNAANYFNVMAPGETEVAFFVGSAEGTAFSGPAPRSGFHTIRVYLMRSAARRGETARYVLTVGVEGASAPDLSAPVVGDFADGLMGGPDFWRVETEGGRLNLRAGPSAGAAILDRLPPGATLRNRGCRMAEGRRWCNVERPETGLGGWVAGEYLREGAPPAADALVPGTPYHATGAVPCSGDGGAPLEQCGFGVTRLGRGAARLVLTAPEGGERVVQFEGGAVAGVEGGAAFSAARDGDRTILRIGLERYDIPDAAPFGG